MVRGFLLHGKVFRIILRGCVTQMRLGKMHTAHMDDDWKLSYFGERILLVGFSFKLWEIFCDFLCKNKLFGEDV